jgi:hypothetical protein
VPPDVREIPLVAQPRPVVLPAELYEPAEYPNDEEPAENPDDEEPPDEDEPFAEELDDDDEEPAPPPPLLSTTVVHIHTIMMRIMAAIRLNHNHHDRDQNYGIFF